VLNQKLIKLTCFGTLAFTNGIWWSVSLFSVPD